MLDEPIDSRTSKPGSYVRAHLRDPLVVGDVTVAPAGTPVRIEVVQADPAQIGNVDGWVEIHFEPLRLPSGRELPLHTPTSHVDPRLTSGQANTRAVTDTLGDIFIPYHYIYHVLRKGMDVDLRTGTVIRARTGATIDTGGGRIAIATPAPFSFTLDKPYADFSPAPLAMPPGYTMPTPKPSVSPSPAATPAATLRPGGRP